VLPASTVAVVAQPVPGSGVSSDPTATPTELPPITHAELLGDWAPTVRAVPEPEPAPEPAPDPLGGPPPPPPRTGTRPRRPIRGTKVDAALGVLLVVLLVVLAAVLIRPASGGHPQVGGTPRPTAAPKPADRVIRAQVSSVDPSGGSGFRKEGAGWRTQSYTSAKFGNLKPGVGLLVDLGTARAVTSISVDAQGPVQLQLRAGDRGSQDAGDYEEVTKTQRAEGATKLDGSRGGEHRYWLVWVTELAPDGGGFSAVLGQPEVRGPA
jgi:hypothetical protein